MSHVPRATALYFSLNEPETIGGAERGLCIANGTMAAAMVLGLDMIEWAPVGLAIHAFCVWLTRVDPMIRRIYIRYNAQGDCYDPWPRASRHRNARPEGFGRGLLC